MAQLESLRETIRALATQHQSQWDSEWKVLLAEPDTTHQGLVAPDAFVQTLENNRVRLRVVDTRALVAHFATRDGRVSVRKFLQWVQIDPPEDHVDPDLVFAQLPQPFRRIAKVLEQDILDVSWEIIKTSSARYKSELSAAAALSVRSARSIALHVGDEALEADDYEDARKRCCKIFDWIELNNLPQGDRQQQEPQSPTKVVGMATHTSLPLLLVGLESPSNGSVSFQLVNTALKQAMGHVTIGETPANSLEPQGESSEPAASTTSTTLYRITSMTSIQARFSGCADPMASLVFAAHVVEETCSYQNTEAGPQAFSTLTSHVHVYEIRDILLPLEETRAEPPAISLVAKASFAEPVASISLSQDGKLLAIATQSSEVSVYALPAADPMETTETVVIDLCSANVPQLKLASIPVSKPPYPIRMHFLVAAETKSMVLPEAASHLLKSYAIAICSHTKLLKYVFPAALTNTTAFAPCKTWTHLTSIATSVLDMTTQYLAVGLSNGSGAVWNVLDDIDHSYLPATGAASAAAYERIVMHQHQFVAALSTASQQCVFFDLTDRSQPKLLRTVTPPSSGSGPVQQHAAVRLTMLVRSTTSLDIPVVLLGYSNGLLLAFDMRNAEAIGGIRYPIEKSIPADMKVGEGSVLATRDYIAIANAKRDGLESLPALQMFDWASLLLTCFPSFDQLLKQRNLGLCVESVKRIFLGSLETVTGSGPESAGDAIESLLCRMAGLKPANAKAEANRSSSQGRNASQESKSVTVLPPLLLFQNADCSQELPPLQAPLLQPLRPDMAALYEQYRREHLGVANWPPDRDVKLHRRQKEMLKAFAASSW